MLDRLRNTERCEPLGTVSATSGDEPCGGARSSSPGRGPTAASSRSTWAGSTARRLSGAPSATRSSACPRQVELELGVAREHVEPAARGRAPAPRSRATSRRRRASASTRFADLLGEAAGIELVADVDAHEGPVYAADEDALYFTTVRRESVAIKRLSLDDGEVTVVRADANTANGMTLDREGRLVVCEQGTRETAARISRLDRTSGAWETLADTYDGLPLNSPNDVVVSSDGAVWFTDPSYGHLQGFRAEPRIPDAVYRVDPSSAAGRRPDRAHARPRRALPARAPAPSGDAALPRVVVGRVHAARHRPPERPPRRLQAEDLDRRALDVPRRRELEVQRRSTSASTPTRITPRPCRTRYSACPRPRDREGATSATGSGAGPRRTSSGSTSGSSSPACRPDFDPTTAEARPHGRRRSSTRSPRNARAPFETVANPSPKETT